MLIEIALRVQRISSNMSGCTGPVFAIFSHHMKAPCMPMMDRYFIFQFVKGCCHGNQIVLPQLSQTDTTCILCRSPDGSSVLFHYYLLGGDIVAPSGLLARLCHAFLVLHVRLRLRAAYQRRGVDVCVVLQQELHHVQLTKVTGRM